MLAKKLNLITAFIALLLISNFSTLGQGTRLLRQPSISQQLIAFEYGADIWVVDKKGGDARRITSTAAVESNPHLSPDGKTIAFSSNRASGTQVYTVSVNGGAPVQLTWNSEASLVRGWTPDGKKILYACARETAPTDYNRLWTVSANGGASTLLPSPFAFSGSYSPDGKKMAIDRVSRWDVEWRNYRGGQNTPLQIIDLATLAEVNIPSDKTMELRPVWAGDEIFFLSDRDWISNVWSFNTKTSSLQQRTKVKGSDVKWVDANGSDLVYEWNGYLHLMDIPSGKSQQLVINVTGDFPWAEPVWETVTNRAQSASLSATGKRIIMEARGEIFTVPVENGDVRNITQSSGVADRQPIWSPDGKQIAWFSDAGGKGYSLHIADQEGTGVRKQISIGESKLGWEPTWSPDSKYIAFVDDDVRIKVLEIATGKIQTADVAGMNLERGGMGITWSPDSKWLAYSKTGSNSLHRIMVWSLDTKKVHALSDPMADAQGPVWDRSGKFLYFLASTNIALGSGWANTSSMQAKPNFAAYVIVLRKGEASPFVLKSDEEPDSTKQKKPASTEKDSLVKIDLDQLDRRTLVLNVPVAYYDYMFAGPKGSVFLGAGPVISKYVLEGNKMEDFTKGASMVSVSANGEKALLRSGPQWRVVATSRPPAPGEGAVAVDLTMRLNRSEEWKQIVEEAWRYMRDYFYDPNMHGRDWNDVWDRYTPLIPFIKHRADLSYVLDMMNGELSVGHSFVFGGDFPKVGDSKVGMLGADLIPESGRWKIQRIYTTESWNPGLEAPLDVPGLKVAEGNYIVAVNGRELLASDDYQEWLDGTVGKQTVLTINSKPGTEGSWTIIVKPVSNENGLRQQAWVENNRRMVDSLSKGRLGYVWVPNTGGEGFVNFNRYYFAQQDKEGAVIDERFNGGGLLDDYMVDLMVRRLRASLTNEVPNGAAMRLPAGILGPKALLINELAGSGGDFFPWIFRHQQVGPLIGTRTWGGLVKSSVHYAFIDGGAMTAPDNAVFDPIAKKWVAENEGVAPDIEQHQEAGATSKGRDLQLERAVQEVLKMLEKEPTPKVSKPAYSTPALKPKA